MPDEFLHKLFDQERLRAAIGADALPGWAVAHYVGFRESMLEPRDGEPFPCYFGVESERNGDALYTFCESMTDEGALSDLADTLFEYVQVFEDFGERTSLVIFFKPPDVPLTEAEYRQRFWGILQYLHDHDPEPWPYDMPTDPTDPYWEFCFAGEPMFPTARAPFYEQRRSRYTAHGLEITAQPRAIFAGITGDTAAGKEARRVIRERIEAYDGMCPHADLGDWGDSHTREWKQYLLPEQTDDTLSTCPLQITALR
ncbi:MULTISPECIES: YqcI/YcgG family protein [unclassified Haladaptatus]|uniref:YqcI/YcgG family protein n=1 Tax=unclassified Haladaptatus TaxID=2622732 RepID=UPI0023E7CBDA|nr:MULTISPECIES: YqcI/YcgG family protein [unclassified Haladaptatus]